MDPITAIGLASAIVTFVDIGTKIAKRMKEMSEAGDIPEVFSDIRKRLPLIISVIGSMQHGSDQLTPETETAYVEVVKRCYEQVNQLDEILKRIIISKGDSRLKKMVRAGVSLLEEQRIHRIATALKDNMELLTLLNTRPGQEERPKAQRWPTEAPPSYKSTSWVFLIPFSRDEHFIGREKSLESIASCFQSQGRVAISGIGGVG